MYGISDELTPRQERAVAALLTSRSLAAAARQAEVGESTLRRWLQKPVFLTELHEARRESFSRALGTLGQVAESAVAVLDAVMHDRTATPASRLRAAQTALRYSRSVGTEGLEKHRATLEGARQTIEESGGEGR